jgi:tRNA(fMet)-specific endonuclease VapC
MSEVLLDTDTLSMIMRQHPAALAQAQAYLNINQRLTFSIITQYEILRGLKAKKAVAQQKAFGEVCLKNNIVPLTEEVGVRASDIYADLHRRGNLIGDADILIAATALVNGLPLVTNNEGHFKRVTGLSLQNWLK